MRSVFGARRGRVCPIWNVEHVNVGAVRALRRPQSRLGKARTCRSSNYAGAAGRHCHRRPMVVRVPHALRCKEAQQLDLFKVSEEVLQFARLRQLVQ